MELCRRIKQLECQLTVVTNQNSHLIWLLDGQMEQGNQFERWYFWVIGAEVSEDDSEDKKCRKVKGKGKALAL